MISLHVHRLSIFTFVYYQIIYVTNNNFNVTHACAPVECVELYEHPSIVASRELSPTNIPQ